MSMKQPISQVRLTNIAVVRYRSGGNNYEIACFPNKVLDWRKKIETNIQNVLQSDTIFKNVSKAEICSARDLYNAFETTDKDAICKIILDKGVMQVTEAERKKDLEKRTKEIVSLVTTMCINKETKLCFSSRMIAAAMRDSHFSVHPTKPTKHQALELIKILATKLPLERVKMRLRLTVTDSSNFDAESLAKLRACYSGTWQALVEAEDTSRGSYEARVLVDPGHFRDISEVLASLTNDKGVVEVMDVAVDEADVAAARARLPAQSTSSSSSSWSKGSGNAGEVDFMAGGSGKAKVIYEDEDGADADESKITIVRVVEPRMPNLKSALKKNGKWSGGYGDEEEEEEEEGEEEEEEEEGVGAVANNNDGDDGGDDDEEEEEEEEREKSGPVSTTTTKSKKGKKKGKAVKSQGSDDSDDDDVYGRGGNSGKTTGKNVAGRKGSKGKNKRDDDDDDDGDQHVLNMLRRAKEKSKGRGGVSDNDEAEDSDDGDARRKGGKNQALKKAGAKGAVAATAAASAAAAGGGKGKGGKKGQRGDFNNEEDEDRMLVNMLRGTSIDSDDDTYTLPSGGKKGAAKGGKHVAGKATAANTSTSTSSTPSSSSSFVRGKAGAAAKTVPASSTTSVAVSGAGGVESGSETGSPNLRPTKGSGGGLQWSVLAGDSDDDDED